jgi:hypothetical protein
MLDIATLQSCSLFRAMPHFMEKLCATSTLQIQTYQGLDRCQGRMLRRTEPFE